MPALRPRLLSAMAIATILGGSAHVQTQSATATIAGHVTDTSGGVLPGVTLTLESAAGEPTRAKAVSRADGRYEFRDVRAGRYRLRAELSGFRPAAVDSLVLAPGGSTVVNVSLAIGPLTIVDHALPEDRLPGQIRESDVVARVRVRRVIVTDLVGRYQNVLATKLEADVLSAIKGPSEITPGATLEFWQHDAGTVRQDDRAHTGPDAVWAPGIELIVMLERTPDHGLATSRGRHSAIPVQNGRVWWGIWHSPELQDGITVEDAVEVLRRVAR